ncbi:Rv3654c family TadE-like protein [Streptomyces sp. NPDC002734]|uniref:Rv3654c family TadE-like protein n=1 Tax=Streptomyces sp. NPDC002734 TaxID=3154426 RepID=UPI003330A4D1
MRSRGGGSQAVRSRGGRGRGDRGSATIWTGAFMSALGVVFAAVLAMSEAVVVRHRASAAADLAALAAARHWPDGTAAACAQADRVVRAQRVQLVRCELVGEVADVVAEAGHGPFTAESRARAGPPAPDPPPIGDAPGPPASPTSPVGEVPGPPSAPSPLTLPS